MTASATEFGCDQHGTQIVAGMLLRGNGGAEYVADAPISTTHLMVRERNGHRRPASYGCMTVRLATPQSQQPELIPVSFWDTADQAWCELTPKPVLGWECRKDTLTLLLPPGDMPPPGSSLYKLQLTPGGSCFIGRCVEAYPGKAVFLAFRDPEAAKPLPEVPPQRPVINPITAESLAQCIMHGEAPHPRPCACVLCSLPRGKGWSPSELEGRIVAMGQQIHLSLRAIGGWLWKGRTFGDKMLTQSSGPNYVGPYT